MPSLTSGNLIGSSVRPVVSQARFSQARPVRQSVSQAWIFSGNLTVDSTAQALFGRAMRRAGSHNVLRCVMRSGA